MKRRRIHDPVRYVAKVTGRPVAKGGKKEIRKRARDKRVDFLFFHPKIEGVASESVCVVHDPFMIYRTPEVKVQVKREVAEDVSQHCEVRVGSPFGEVGIRLCVDLHADGTAEGFVIGYVCEERVRDKVKKYFSKVREMSVVVE